MNNLFILNTYNVLSAFGTSKSGKEFYFPNITLASAHRVSILSYNELKYSTRIVVFNHGQTAIVIETKCNQ